jgi:membrane-associated protease RseP (regulator of RpoE activity)
MHPPPWGQEMDYNLVQKDGATPEPASALQKQSGRDSHSITADADFLDPAKGDYRVKEGSPALALGFANFPMDQFGVQNPALKAIARKPALPEQKAESTTPRSRATTPRQWLGASVRNIADEGEMSAFGLPGVMGVLVLDVPANSALAKSGLQKSDVILSLNGAKTADVATLLQQTPVLNAGQSLTLHISRHQKEITLAVTALGQ